MRALELSLRNYRVFEEVDLELPARVIGIFGPNGSGKSTLVEAIAVALYGVSAARTKKQEIRTQGLLTDCEVRLAFEHAGQQYEVRRSLRGRGHAPEAELYGGGLLLASGVTEVDVEVQRLLHMDLGVFRASVYAEQKQLDAFSDVTSGKRKEMALRLLGIRPVDDARKAARADARSVKQLTEQMTGAVADIADLEARLKEAQDRAREAAGFAEATTGRLTEATRRATEAAAVFEAGDAARQRVEKLRVAIDAAVDERERLSSHRAQLVSRVEDLHERLAGLPALREELDRLADAEERLQGAERVTRIAEQLARAEEALGSLPPMPADAMGALAAAEQTRAEAWEAATRAEEARERAAEALAAATVRVERASEADPSEPCPTCGQPLGEGFAVYVRHAKSEAAQVRKALAQAEKSDSAAASARDRAERAWVVAKRTADAASSVGEERARIEAQLQTIRVELAEATGPFDGEVPDPARVRVEVDRAKELSHEIAVLVGEARHAEHAAGDVEAADVKLAELDHRLGGLTEEAEGLAFDQRAYEASRAMLADAQAHLEAARHEDREAANVLATAEKEASGLGGRLHEARETERRVDELRSEARYLERTAMLLDGFRDHLVGRVGPELSREAEALFRELTNHEYDDLRIDEESLAIQIADGETYFAVERFSGSEADLANLALRVAISTHLSRVSGADLGMMVLDEVFGSLDQERRDLMVRTMGGLAGRFHQLFVITHAEQLKDQFPVAIHVAKSGRRRSIAVVA